MVGAAHCVGRGRRRIHPRRCSTTYGSAIVALLLFSISGCSIVISGGADSQETVNAYREVLRTQVLALHDAGTALHPACDTGGGLTQCRPANQEALATFRSAKSALGAVKVPGVVRDPHDKVMAGLQIQIEGFARRDEAISSGNNADWRAGNDLLAKGGAELESGLSEFPRGWVTSR